MNSVHDLISGLGGVPVVSRALSLPRSTVAYWAKEKRNRIPFDYWDAIIGLAKKQGIGSVNKDLLGRICRPRKKRGS